MPMKQNGGRRDMEDFWFLATTLAFFVIAIGYTYGCDRL